MWKSVFKRMVGTSLISTGECCMAENRSRVNGWVSLGEDEEGWQGRKEGKS